MARRHQTGLQTMTLSSQTAPQRGQGRHRGPPCTALRCLGTRRRQQRMQRLPGLHCPPHLLALQLLLLLLPQLVSQIKPFSEAQARAALPSVHNRAHPPPSRRAGDAQARVLTQLEREFESGLRRQLGGNRAAGLGAL